MGDRKLNVTIYTACYIKFYPIKRVDTDFYKILQTFQIDGFFSNAANIKLQGYNKSSSATIAIPMNDSYTNLDLSIDKRPQDKNKIKENKNKRDLFHKYLLENKWLQVEIYAVESRNLITSNHKAKVDAILSKREKNTEDFYIQKLFDGLGTDPEFTYSKEGQYVVLKCQDRMALLDNYIFDGKLTNNNSKDIIQTLCNKVGLKFVLSKGYEKGKAAYAQWQDTNPANIIDANKVLEQGLKSKGENIGGVADPNEENNNVNLLSHAESATSIISKLAKMENAAFYVRGNTLYFGGIEKNKFHHLTYKWGADIIKMKLKRNMPKPLKAVDKTFSHFPYYIELRTYDAKNGKTITVTRGKMPPKLQNDRDKAGGKTEVDKLEYEKFIKGKVDVAIGAGAATEYIESFKSGAVDEKYTEEVGKADPSSNTIYIYQQYTSVTKAQLEKIASNLETALKYGAVTGELEIPIDYDIEPFDSIQILNIGAEFEKLVFNITGVDMEFSTDSGFTQNIEISTGYDSIFEGNPEDTFKARKKKQVTIKSGDKYKEKVDETDKSTGAGAALDYLTKK